MNQYTGYNDYFDKKICVGDTVVAGTKYVVINDNGIYKLSGSGCLNEFELKYLHDLLSKEVEA